MPIRAKSKVFGHSKQNFLDGFASFCFKVSFILNTADGRDSKASYDGLKNSLIAILVKWVDKSISTTSQTCEYYLSLKFLYYYSKSYFMTRKNF